MKRIALILLVALVLVSCESYEQVENKVSNQGTITTSVVAGKETLKIDFVKTESGAFTDDKAKTFTQTIDTGRYDTLVKAFTDNGLKDGKKYPCSVTSTSVTSVIKNGKQFGFYEGDRVYCVIKPENIYTNFDAACSMTITYGEEDIITYPNLPTSPDGLPAGTLWNDNGIIKVVL